MGDFSIAVGKLEFGKVIQRIIQLATSEPGRMRAASLSPIPDPATIIKELQRVTEVKELIVAEGALPLDGIKNILPALKKTLVEGSFLSAQELLDISSTLAVARVLHGFFAKRKAQSPSVYDLILGLYADKVVEFNITQAVDETGQIRDTASKELRSIRQELIGAAEQLRRRLASILRKVSEEELTQDDIITTRDGRLVIPVKTEFKHRVPGLIHSSSASGATVFIEPAETLDLNNHLRELQLQEQREIERILRNLTAQVREIREQLERSVKTLAEIDLIEAKAKYSIAIIGSAPHLTNEVRIRLKEARHPLLLQAHGLASVVPLDLELGGEVNTLLITGPNAGGKSVALKTVGLCVLMTQAGVPIPASVDSQLPVFEKIFVDIGDDQSVENDLSTFSSHLVRLAQILQEADDRTLVLIDEIGAGTDPSEGGALAAAILTELTARRCLTIATTHHGSLKIFAHEQPGMTNGSMEFDQESLRPTYRFRSGIPGSSYALELAHRMGLPERILKDAHSKLGTEKTKLESLLATLERESQQYKEQLHALTREKARLDTLVSSYEARLSEVRMEIRDLKQKAADEARDLVKNAQSIIERTVKEIRESSAARTTVQAARHTLRDLLPKEAPPVEDAGETQELRPGDAVRLKGGTEVGELKEIRESSGVVLWKNGTLIVNLRDLVKAGEKSGELTSISVANYQPEGKTELDLRGLTGEEAVEKVQRFLDDALVSGLHRVDIIHGKGTGALRKRITEFLKTRPHVRNFHLGEWNEGGSGVTVVELDE